MWTKTDSFTRFLLSKLKTRRVLLLSHPGHILHGYIFIFWLSWSPKQRDLNVLHYHGVYISKHKTVLKYWVKGKKHKESSDKV